MAQNTSDTVSVNVVVWPQAVKWLQSKAGVEYRAAARGTTEFERGRRSGRGEMCEELQNLPQALALLAEEDNRERTDRERAVQPSQEYQPQTPGSR